MTVRIHALALLAMLMLTGCQPDATEPAGSDAEVPQPGPAIEDPGPAPAGQWEPPVDPGDSGQDAATESTEPSAPADSPSAETPEVPAAPSEAASDETTGTTEERSGSGAETSAAPTGDPAGTAGVTLQLQAWDQTEKLIASHKGKVVVVDFWSTSCLPCRREFPHLVALQHAYPEKVACVSVSLDYTGRKSRPPESYRDSVLEFLNQQQATIDNVLSIDDPDELDQRLELAPIPLVWVFDGDGQRRRTFDNGDLQGEEFTYEKDVVPFVESLLSES